MRVRSLILAFLLATGLAAAAGKTKPVKVKKHAVTTPKTSKRSKEATKGEVHKAPKVAKHKVSTPKVVKHKPANFKKHKA
jgi:hypothetical protein